MCKSTCCPRRNGQQKNNATVRIGPVFIKSKKMRYVNSLFDFFVIFDNEKSRKLACKGLRLRTLSVNHNNVIEQIADKLIESQNDRLNGTSVRAVLNKQKVQLEKQIENFLDAIGKGITTMSTKIKLENLEQELADVSTKITAEECKQRIGLSRAEIIG